VKVNPSPPARKFRGVFEGSDSVLKNDDVALGAHYDHVGVGIPVNRDAISTARMTTVPGYGAARYGEACGRPPATQTFGAGLFACGEEK